MGKIKLIRSTPGDGMAEVIGAFKVSYQEKPFNTFLVLPNVAIRDNVKHSIAESGVPVFGASVCTLNELAEYFFDFYNRTESKLDDYANELILYKLLEENRDRLTLFNGAWGTIQAMVPELRAFLETLQDYQVEYPRCLGDLQSIRSEQLGQLRDLYMEFLNSNHLVDRGSMLNWVTKELIGDEGIEIENVYFYGLFEPKPIERDLIRAIARISQRTEYHIPFADDSKAFSDNGSWLNAEEMVECKGNDFERTISGHYTNTSRVHLDNIVKGVFNNKLEEMRFVANEIGLLISTGTRPGSIAVMLPIRSKSAPLVREVFEDCDIPFDLHQETPLSESPLVMSIFSIMDAVKSDYDRDILIRLVSSPFFAFKYPFDGKEVVLQSYELDNVSLEAGIIGGKDAWTSSLNSLATQIKDELADSEDETSNIRLRNDLDRTVRIERGLHLLIEVLSPLGGEQTVKQRADVLRKLMIRFDLTRNLETEDIIVYEQEVRALKSFLSALEAMEMGEFIAPSGMMDLSEFLAKLRMLASAEGFQESPENRNAVQVSGLRASYLMHYDHIFVVGMVDGDIPFLAAGNSFVREREAARMGLLRKEDVLRQERYYFISTLLSANVRSYISRPESDEANMLVPSSFFDDLEAAFDMDMFGGNSQDTSSLRNHRHIGEMISKKNDLERIGVNVSFDLEEIFHRIAVECDERAGDYQSPYDGVFSDPMVITDLNTLLAKRNVFSPSRLESYARCPFRYYLNHVLGIEPMEEIETELTPASRGTLFHRIAYRFYSELREEGKTRFSQSEMENMVQKIRRIGQEELDRYQFSGPAWEAFQATLLGSDQRKGLLRVFLEKELTNQSCLDPTYFELSFGLPIEGEEDPASRSDPVEIDLGKERLKLRCRIDRVDIDPQGHFVVIDYKTGGSAPTVSSIEKGIALQLPLYIQAVESAMEQMDGIGGAYYGVRSESNVDHKCIFGDKNHSDLLKPYFGEKKRYKEGFAEIIAQSNQFVLTYLESMRAGRFHPNIGPANCPNGCEYAAVCRTDPDRLGGEGDDN